MGNRFDRLNVIEGLEINSGVQVFEQADVLDTRIDAVTSVVFENVIESYNNGHVRLPQSFIFDRYRNGEKIYTDSYSPYEAQALEDSDLTLFAKKIAKIAFSHSMPSLVLIDKRESTLSPISIKKASRDITHAVDNGSSLIINAWARLEGDDDDKEERALELSELVRGLDLPTLDLELIKATTDVHDRFTIAGSRQALLAEEGLIVASARDF
jgi:hypothetical protein